MNIAPSVWMQPASLFATWKGRGFASLLGCPLTPDLSATAEGLSFAQWAAAADAAGMTYWLPAVPGCIPLFNLANCAGVLYIPDEPNGDGNQPPEAIAQGIAWLRNYTNKPVIVDLDGSRFEFEPDELLAAYYAHADICAADYHVLNRGETDLGAISRTIQRIQRVAPGKPIIFIGECSDQLLKCSPWGQQVTAQGKTMRGPNGVEWAQEYDLVRSNNAAYSAFADVFGKIYPDGTMTYGWNDFDGTTDSVAAAMKAALVPAPATPPTPPQPATPVLVFPDSITLSGGGQSVVYVQKK